MIIRDAQNGVGAGVTDDGLIKVVSDSQPIQHHASLVHASAYQVIGDFAALNNSTENILHIKNTSSTHDFAATYIRIQALDMAGGTAIPAAETYFDIVSDLVWSSGGTAVTPVNMNLGSGKSASLTCYDGDPVLTGTAVEFDRWYVEADGKMMTFNKEGALILSQNQTLTIRCTTDHTSGVAYARISGIFTAAQ